MPLGSRKGLPGAAEAVARYTGMFTGGAQDASTDYLRYLRSIKDSLRFFFPECVAKGSRL